MQQKLNRTMTTIITTILYSSEIQKLISYLTVSVKEQIHFYFETNKNLYQFSTLLHGYYLLKLIFFYINIHLIGFIICPIHFGL